MTQYLQRSHDIGSADLPLVLDELSLWASRFGAVLLENIELRANAHILDVGCGTGFPLLELANIYGPTCRVVGIDVWQEALDRANAKLRVHGLPNAHIVGADAALMPFRASSFDMVVSNLGLNNFEDPQAVLDECFRVARPGAKLVLTTNVEGHMREFYDVYRETLIALGKSEGHMERLRANEGHRGTKEWVCDLVEEAGFAVSRTVEDSFAMRYLDGTAFLNHTFNRFAFLDGWRGVVEPPEEDEVFATLESNLNRLVQEQGELRVSVPVLYVEAGRVEAGMRTED
jgi:ubiquinone/menaquinone biosynthesis C-methylase UbiE